VTGGSTGIGRAVAMELVQEGARVAVCARNAGRLHEAAERSPRRGRHQPGARHPADVTRAEDVEQLVARVVSHWSRLDILVNNAGRATPGRFGDLTDEAWPRHRRQAVQHDPHVPRRPVPSAGQRRRAHREHQFRLRQGARPHFFATSVNRASCLAFTKALQKRWPRMCW